MQQTIAALVGLFAAVGVLVAAAGLYGLMSFLVARRTQEVGVRMTLGATPGEIAALVLGHAMRWSALGAGAGVAGSLAAGRLLWNLLFGVGSSDPLSVGAAAVFLLDWRLRPALAPSLRAARTEPNGAASRVGSPHC